MRAICVPGSAIVHANDDTQQWPWRNTPCVAHHQSARQERRLAAHGAATVEHARLCRACNDDSRRAVATENDTLLQVRWPHVLEKRAPMLTFMPHCSVVQDTLWKITC